MSAARRANCDSREQIELRPALVRFGSLLRLRPRFVDQLREADDLGLREGRADAPELIAQPVSITCRIYGSAFPLQRLLRGWLARACALGSKLDGLVAQWQL
jgi:hypothetical protein